VRVVPAGGARPERRESPLEVRRFGLVEDSHLDVAHVETEWVLPEAPLEVPEAASDAVLKRDLDTKYLDLLHVTIRKKRKGGCFT
jgi:hypothetical protein